MLLDFEAVYDLEGTYYEFWYWAVYLAGFIGHLAGFGLVLSHRPGNPAQLSLTSVSS